jgi:RNA polymerase sigma-70 factor (ECF subfamily)
MGDTSGTPPAASPGFEQVFRDHHAFVWRVLRRLGVPEASADDAVQDVFLVLARRFDEFDESRGSMRGWLVAIATRVARQHRRALGRRHRLLAAFGREPGPSTVGTGGATDERSAANVLHALLDTLDEDKRIVLVLLELEQMTGQEVASLLGLKVPTVHSRLRLARAELKRAYARLRAREGGSFS